MSEKIALRAVDLTKSYSESGQVLEVLRGVSLEVREGEAVAIIGTSGSGKTTLLQCLGGLDSFDSGLVEVDGENLANLSEKNRTELRNRKLGFVYQFHHLLPEFTSMENVAMPLKIRRENAADAEKKANELLEALGLRDRRDHLPSQLSGGERQRVAIARAMAGSPFCLLADEPTGNLDRETAENVFGYLLNLTRQQHLAFVIVTHDPELASKCDRIVRLKAGQLTEEK